MAKDSVVRLIAHVELDDNALPKACRWIKKLIKYDFWLRLQINIKKCR